MVPEKAAALTLLGSAGGVADAVLSLLNHSCRNPDDPLYSLLQRSNLHLIDSKQKPLADYESKYPNLIGKLIVHGFDANEPNRMAKHLKQVKPQLVIDVSWADSATMLQLCASCGIDYINTALENTEVDEDESLEGYTLLERYHRFEKVKNKTGGNRSVLCSGMNPGVVQWMALELMKNIPGEIPSACYIIEKDDSFFKDPFEADAETVYTTWSPECFLDEAILNYPLFVRNGLPHLYANEVYGLEFSYQLGDMSMTGQLMPHEESLTLGAQFSMETGFLYQVNSHTIDLIRRNLHRKDEIWEFDMKVLQPGNSIEGSDLVGILLVYSDRELYMYNEMDNGSAYRLYGTNATYYQVACGVYAGLATLLLDGLPEGCYYVDELLLRTNSRYGEYVKVHMPTFITGENPESDGLLADRVTILP